MEEMLDKLFDRLCAAGYDARQNFMCCTNCACAAFPEGTKKAVYYTEQDAEYMPLGRVFLGWVGDGHEIVRIASEVGFEVEWNGQASQKIFVRMPMPQQMLETEDEE
jgi:hypothetical protein